MRIFHIATRSDYTKDGEQRRKYYKAGSLYIDEATGRMNMRLYHNPGIRYYFFDSAEDEKLPPVDAYTGSITEEN